MSLIIVYLQRVAGEYPSLEAPQVSEFLEKQIFDEANFECWRNVLIDFLGKEMKSVIMFRRHNL
jgi:hypothetical protein